MEVWLKDEKTGLEVGINDDGDLFFGDERSGGNLRDTPENRERLIQDFYRSTGREKQVIMEAQFEVIPVDGMTLEEHLEEENSYMDIGGFRFVVDGKEIPFDFEATSRHVEGNLVTFGNYQGFMENIYDIEKNVYTDEYGALGITEEDITAKLLASVEKIEDFYINLCDGNDQEIPFLLQLKSIGFTDEFNKEYMVSPPVLTSYLEPGMIFAYESSYGDTELVRFSAASYAKPKNLYVGMECYDKENGFWKPYGDVTLTFSPQLK